CRSAQIIVFATTCLLVCRPYIQAQSSHSSASCDDSDKDSRAPEISIVDVTFSGSLQMPVSEQEEIANSIKQKTHGTSLDDVTGQGLERIRRGWQDRGYFKVQITGEARTFTSNPPSQRVALLVDVDEGSQYKLSGITFKNNKV